MKYCITIYYYGCNYTILNFLNQALGDLVESCFGAILLDSGFDLNLVWEKMLSFMDPVINLSKLQLNPVRELQELCQSYGWDQQFPTLKKSAAFFVEAKVTGEDVYETACATNPSRKAAKTMAAQLVVGKLKVKDYLILLNYLVVVLVKTEALSNTVVKSGNKCLMRLGN